MASEYATFETSDAREQIAGLPEAAPPPGRALVDTLIGTIRLNPSATISSTSQHDAYGWAFDVHFDGVRVWCMLQRSDTWLLITKVRTSLIDRLKGRDFSNQHAKVVALLDEGLRALGVQDLRWFSRVDFESQARAR